MTTVEIPGEALAQQERARLAAVLADWSAPDFLTVRAVAVANAGAPERLARLTAMGREFIVEARRCARYDGVATVLAATPSAHERVLENATRQLVAAGRDHVTMQRVSRDTGIPRRTLYHLYSAGELASACRRRAQTVWRAHFEQNVVRASTDPKRRLFAVVETLDGWVGSARFHADQSLCARASFGERSRDDDLREHFAEIERFAARLAGAARLAAPDAFGAFVATSVAGAAAWFDRRAAARAAAFDTVERALARRA